MGRVILLMWLCLLAGAAWGQSVQSDVVADHSGVAPGGVVRIGIQLHVIEREPSLWLAAGERRLVNTVAWRLEDEPANARLAWTAGSEWSGARLGYEGVVMLEAALRVSAGAGGRVAFAATVAGEMSQVEVAVGEEKKANEAMFASWDERVPLTAPEQPAAILTKRNGVEYRVHLEMPGKTLKAVVGVPRPERRSGMQIPIVLTLPDGVEWARTPQLTGIWYLQRPGSAPAPGPGIRQEVAGAGK